MSGLKKIALRIKESSRTLSVIGFVFVVASVIFGILWLLCPENNKLEPTTYVLTVCTTIFFGLPQLAEFILPSRKPIRHMTYDEIMEFIITTNPKEDWNGVSTNWISEKFLKEDPRLRFRAKYTEDGIQNENFVEPWANCFFNPHATGYWYDLFFDGNLIERFLLVSVDGGLALLPPPEFNTNIISTLNYRVAQIHNIINNLDDYIRRANLTI